MGLIPYINDFDIVVVFIPIIVIVHAEFLLPFFLVAQGRIQTGFQTQDGKQVVHIVRHRRFKGNGFAGFRVHKAQAVGMQGLACAEGFDGFFNCVAAWVAQIAVNRVGGQRMVASRI